MNYNLMFDIYKDACFCIGIPVSIVMVLFCLNIIFYILAKMTIHPIFLAHAFIKYGFIRERIMGKRFWKIRTYLKSLSNIRENLIGYSELTTGSHDKCNFSIDFNRIIPKYIFRPPDSKTGSD